MRYLYIETKPIVDSNQIKSSPDKLTYDGNVILNVENLYTYIYIQDNFIDDYI